jgi:hypothetical protein
LIGFRPYGKGLLIRAVRDAGPHDAGKDSSSRISDVSANVNAEDSVWGLKEGVGTRGFHALDAVEACGVIPRIGGGEGRLMESMPPAAF